MKKLFCLMLGATSLLLSSFFVSCKQVGQYDANLSGGVSLYITDLNSPVLKGASYYGVNYVWWDAVAGAHSYSIYRNGEFKKSVEIDSGNCSYEDTAIENGKRYRYQVVAVSSSDPSREAIAVASVRSSSSTIELTAIVPTVEQYNKAVKDSLGIENGVSPKISIVSGATGNVVVDFPSKAYLKYTVYTVEKGLVTEFSDPLSIATVADASKTIAADYLTENSTIRAAIPVVAAGNKEIYVLVEPKAKIGITGWGNFLVGTNSNIKYEKIDELGSSTEPKSVWTDVSAKKARVYWKPATVSTGLKAPTNNFVVYRKQAGEWAKVDGTVKEDTTGLLYYIDDTLPFVTADVTYYVVHTDGKLYGTKVNTTLSASYIGNAGAAAFIKASTTSAALDEDKVANDVLVTVSVPVDVTLAAVEYTESKFKLSDYSYKALTVPTVYTDSEGKKLYVISGKDFDDGTYVFRAKTSKDGYADSYSYSENVTVDSSLTATEAATLNVTLGDYFDDGSENDAFITVTAKNKNQTLALAYAYSDKSAGAAKAAFYNGATSATFPAKSSTVAGAKKYEFIIDNLKDGYYFFVLTASETGYNAITTTKSVSVDTGSLSVTKDVTLAVEFGDYAADGTENDAFFTVTAGNHSQTLDLAYGYSDKSANAAKAAYYKSSTAIELPSKYSIVPEGDKYEFIMSDLKDGYYFFVLTASEEGYDSTVTTLAKALDTSVAIEKTGVPTLTITANAYGSDSAKNDIYISATKANADQKLTLYYGYSKNSAEEAKADARTKYKTWELPAAGYNNTFKLIKEDVEDGYYFAYLYAEEEGHTPNEATSAFVIDTSVEERFAEKPWSVQIDNLGKNGRTFQVIGKNNIEIVYGYSTLSYDDAEYNAYANPVEVPRPESGSWYDKWRYAMGFDVKDLEPGYYWFVIKCSQEGTTPVTIDYNSAEYIEGHLDDNGNWVDATWNPLYATLLRFEVPAEPAEPTEDNSLGDIIINGDADITTLSFINKDGDGKYDDLADFTITIPDNAFISSIRYIATTDKVEAQNLVLSGGTELLYDFNGYRRSYLDQYSRKFANNDPDNPGEILNEYDNFKGVLDNVKVFDEAGNKLYYAFIIEIDDYIQNEMRFKNNFKYKVITATPYVMDNYNDDLLLKVLRDSYDSNFDISITDVVRNGDTISNYTYTLQWAKFDLESGSMITPWDNISDIEEDIELTAEEAGNQMSYIPNNYVYSKSLKYNTKGIYMFRVVKHSNLTGTDVVATIHTPYTIGSNSTPSEYTLDTLKKIDFDLTSAFEPYGDGSGQTARTKAILTFTLENDANMQSEPWTADTNYKYSIYRATYEEIAGKYTSKENSAESDQIVIDNYELRDGLELSAYTYVGTYEQVDDGEGGFTNKPVIWWHYNQYRVEDKIEPNKHYFYYLKAENTQTGTVIYSALKSIY